MRLGGFLFLTAASLAPGGCALPAEPAMACADAVSVPFPKGGAELNLAAVNKVLMAASTLNACPEARATVTGHADTSEQPALAGARAANVASVIAKNGIDQRRLIVTETGARRQAARQPNNRFVEVAWH